MGIAAAACMMLLIAASIVAACMLDHAPGAPVNDRREDS